MKAGYIGLIRTSSTSQISIACLTLTTENLPARRPNYLLLGLSLPIVSELYAATPVEFLRTLNVLLSEFDTFQQLHSENSSTRPQLKNMFRRQTGKSRRSTVSASDAFLDEQTAVGAVPVGTAHNVINFAASESDLHPGEEYNFLLTPSLPFDPDYYETFATLCDVLIEAYTKFLSFLHTPKECTPTVAELFNKVDTRVRKLIVQGVVKEFEEHSKTHTKTEIAKCRKSRSRRTYVRARARKRKRIFCSFFS